ncbi:Structural maintenance of chromosomes protein 4 [Microbotryomycetes sp. JL221]|nr:Structural maintenance of chromosomes protein 4 [Microbotryomycetes sp. JL221]
MPSRRRAAAKQIQNDDDQREDSEARTAAKPGRGSSTRRSTKQQQQSRPLQTANSGDDSDVHDDDDLDSQQDVQTARRPEAAPETQTERSRARPTGTSASRSTRTSRTSMTDASSNKQDQMTRGVPGGKRVTGSIASQSTRAARSLNKARVQNQDQHGKHAISENGDDHGEATSDQENVDPTPQTSTAYRARQQSSNNTKLTTDTVPDTDDDMQEGEQKDDSQSVRDHDQHAADFPSEDEIVAPRRKATSEQGRANARRRVLEDEEDEDEDREELLRVRGTDSNNVRNPATLEKAVKDVAHVETPEKPAKSQNLHAEENARIQDANSTPRSPTHAKMFAKAAVAPTPAAAHMVPTAYDLAAAAREAALNHAALEKERERERDGKPRLVIHQLVLEDFKSYRGRNVIGPFHKSFSSIVGPNGSGKSNTIDALLFVFGYRATKMRQGKLNELIHNSGTTSDVTESVQGDGVDLVEGAEYDDESDDDAYDTTSKGKKGKKSKRAKKTAAASSTGGMLDSCTVEVWFREIIDLPGGRDEFSVVPNSSLVVARTAYRNNSSRYTINGKTSNYSEVTTLLKARGIDLDHKRFLILQGEVESIAQMKPKGASEHDEGLLEYLEDIIGTSKYKAEIDQAMVEVERLNEERGTQMNRVKLVEREKSALEGRRREADGYLRDQNELAHNQSALFQINIHQANQNSKQHQADLDGAEAELVSEIEAQADIIKEAELMQREYDGLVQDTKEVEKATNEIVKQLAVLERADVQLQEKKKSAAAKIKKLRKNIVDDTHAKSEAETWVQNHAETIDRVSGELEKMSAALEKEETELEKVRDGLKGKTEVYSVQIEQLQQELQPWASQIAKKQAEIDLALNEQDMLSEKGASLESALADAAETLEKLARESEAKAKDREALLSERADLLEQASGLETQLQTLATKDAKLRAQSHSARLKAEEAKASQSASRSQGNVLASLTKLKDQGRLPGFWGRLGDLGRIDDQYDVAISTAAPGLDNLVTDTIAIGQACIEHLRKNELGRANIMCLDRIGSRDMSRIKTPENAPRLFDLVTPKDPRLAPAFYQILTNTLVATDLEQGKRLAFGSGKRWRVVTLDGQLIDMSGTMSGGGGRPARGRMSSKIASDDVTPEFVANCEREHRVANEALQAFVSDCQKVEQDLRAVQKRLPEIDMSISKVEMELEANVQRTDDTERLLAELKAQSKPDAGEAKKIARLTKMISSLESEMVGLQSETSAIDSKIKRLQDKILEVGGIKLRSQQTLVQDLKAQIDAANERLTKAEVGRVKSERDIIKLAKSISTNETALGAVESDLKELTRQINDGSEEAETVRRHVEEAQAVLDEKKEELNEMKAVLDERVATMTEFRKRQADLTRQRDEAKKSLKEDLQAVEHWVSRLGELELNELVGDDNDEEGEKDDGEQGVARLDAELREWTIEELAEFDTKVLKAKISALEERIAQANLDISVLQEYARREREFMQRAADLEAVTKERDAAKQKAEELRNQRLREFMEGFGIISMKLKEMYQMITLGGNAELELVDSLDPFSEGIIFSVMPPKKSWKNISNLSGGEKTLSSLALVFALHVFKPTPLYFMDEIDAALDFRNVSIVANYIKDRTKNAQFIIISLRNNMFELSSRLIGIYKVANQTRSVAIDNKELPGSKQEPADDTTARNL